MNRRLELCLLVSVLLIVAFMGCVSEGDIQFPGAPIISVENISYLGNGYLEYTLVAEEPLPYDVRVDLLITTNDEKFTSSPMMKGGTVALRSGRYLRENGGLITLEIQPWEDSGDDAYNVGSPLKLTVVAEPYFPASDLESSTTRVEVVSPPHATMVTVEPPPGAIIPSNQEFRLTLDAAVIGVSVNGRPSPGSALNWSADPDLNQGVVNLNIVWVNRDSTTGSQVVGPYTVRDE